MNLDQQTPLPFDLDGPSAANPIRPTVSAPTTELADTETARSDQPVDTGATHPNAATHVLRRRPSSKHTLAAFPPGKADDTVGGRADPEPAPLLLRIPEAGRLLGLGRTTMYELISAGEVEVVHIGRAARIPLDSVERFVDRLRSLSPTAR